MVNCNRRGNVLALNIITWVVPHTLEEGLTGEVNMKEWPHSGEVDMNGCPHSGEVDMNG